MVRPDRLERPTFWFVASNQRTFTDLAVGTVVTNHCSLLRVIKDFRAFRDKVLAMLRNPSTLGVGTKWAQFGGDYTRAKYQPRSSILAGGATIHRCARTIALANLLVFLPSTRP